MQPIFKLPVAAAAGAAVLLLLVAAGPMAQQAGRPTHAPDGRAIYRNQCASCHGARGEGGKGYSRPLTGDRTVADLTKYIAKSMPPGPKKCAATDAPRVAKFIYESFYSPVAQARNRPARISLSRLTVRQFRNAVTDLIGGFQRETAIGDARGLHAEYFKTRQFDGNSRGIDRIDPQVQFDFGTGSPAPTGFNPHQFSARWNGAVLAPDTGEYEFVVHSDHSVRLWVNDNSKPLIDAWVKSGKDTEFRGAITLLGGRFYPIRLEFSKSTQGVDDSDKEKSRPVPKAFIALNWKRPKLAEETIPQRCLAPVSLDERFVAATPFPPDDRSIGYERGSSVSKAWDEATTNASLETANYVASHLRALTGVPDDAADRRPRIQEFCRRFVERAFSRPLTDDLARFYVARPFETTPDLQNAVKRVVLLTLKSPRFLYRDLGVTRSDAYAVAARLSFGLWDSLPDAELLRAAADGRLARREEVAQQAERMIADPRSWFKLRDFFFQWLRVDQTPDLVKDAKRYAGFDGAAAADLRDSLDLFLQNTVWSAGSDYRDLMLSDKVYMNGRLAKLYGCSMPPDADFQPVALDTGERRGVLTQPYLLASFAYLDASSPIHRGVLIYRNVMGRVLQPPPQAFAPLAASAHPELTTRQRVALQTKPAFCNGCHGRINPMGYTLERFDAIGKLRTVDNNRPVDPTGSYETRTGKMIHFANAAEMAKYIANSDEAHAAFIEKLFHHLVKQPVLAYGPQTLPGLQRAFEANNCSIKRLMVDIMADTALRRDGAGRKRQEAAGKREEGTAMRD